MIRTVDETAELLMTIIRARIKKGQPDEDILPSIRRELLETNSLGNIIQIVEQSVGIQTHYGKQRYNIVRVMPDEYREDENEMPKVYLHIHLDYHTYPIEKLRKLATDLKKLNPAIKAGIVDGEHVLILSMELEEF
jgi:hypothetical protein